MGATIQQTRFRRRYAIIVLGTLVSILAGGSLAIEPPPPAKQTVSAAACRLVQVAITSIIHPSTSDDQQTLAFVDSKLIDIDGPLHGGFDSSGLNLATGDKVPVVLCHDREARIRLDSRIRSISYFRLYTSRSPRPIFLFASLDLILLGSLWSARKRKSLQYVVFFLLTMFVAATGFAMLHAIMSD